MKFPIAIEHGDDETAFGVVVPDLPGCFSAGDTLDEAIDSAREAIELWVETVIEDGEKVPTPTRIDAHYKNPEFSGWTWAVVDVDIERFLGPAHKINITVPALLLARIDDFTKAHGESRSGFLARAAVEAMSREVRQMSDPGRSDRT